MAHQARREFGDRTCADLSRSSRFIEIGACPNQSYRAQQDGSKQAVQSLPPYFAPLFRSHSNSRAMDQLSFAPAARLSSGCRSATRKSAPASDFAQNARRAWRNAVGRPAPGVSLCWGGEFFFVGDFGDRYGAYMR